MITINTDGVLATRECRAPRPVPHTPGHCKGSFPCILLQRSHTLPFPAQPIGVSNSFSPVTRLIRHPASMGRFGLRRPSQQSRRTPSAWNLQLWAFPEKQATCPWPQALSHTPSCLVSTKARSLASAVHLNLYFRVTHRRAPDKFCLGFHSSRNFPRLVLVMREKQGSRLGEYLSFPTHISNPTFLPYSEVTTQFGHTCPMFLHLWDWFILWECQYLQLSLIRFPDPSRPGLDS